jgi:putative transposase
MKRQASQKVAQRNEMVLTRIRQLKADHPFWGYRRLWAHLRYIDKMPINRKRVLRVLRQADLLVKPNCKLKALRVPMKSKPRPTRPNQWWGIDMTKVLVETFGWVYIVVVLDWYTKKIVGYQIGLQSKARHWLEAVDMAVNRQFPGGVEGQELSLMSDNGCQPTSLAFMRECSRLGIKQAFTSYNNPKGNADTERMMRTIKEECLWLREWTSPFELAHELKEWFEKKYNEKYLHSALGYRTPVAWEQQWQQSHQTQLVGA